MGFDLVGKGEKLRKCGVVFDVLFTGVFLVKRVRQRWFLVAALCDDTVMMDAVKIDWTFKNKCKFIIPHCRVVRKPRKIRGIL